VEASAKNRLISVTLDENSIGRFALAGHNGGPYALTISLVDAKLVFQITDESGANVVTHILSLTPFRRILKDYFLICESYYAAIRTATPSRIEAIDMGRRGLHNEGAQLLAERLKGKIDTDPDTARRLFTLITALHWKG
jgi:uncharacterized protein (UPF0262 family)